jgi:hypothetical protein
MWFWNAVYRRETNSEQRHRPEQIIKKLRESEAIIACRRHAWPPLLCVDDSRDTRTKLPTRAAVAKPAMRQSIRMVSGASTRNHSASR